MGRPCRRQAPPRAHRRPTPRSTASPSSSRTSRSIRPDVTSGTAVSLAVSNAGPTPHNVAIRDESGTELATTADLREGESETLTVDLSVGDYILFCSLPGHESLGIKGTLSVQ